MKVGQAGVRIILNLQADLEDATDLLIRYKKPDGTVGTWSAELDDTMTKIQYTTLATDLDQAGEWKFEPDITLDGFSGPVDGVGTLYVEVGLAS